MLAKVVGTSALALAAPVVLSAAGTVTLIIPAGVPMTVMVPSAAGAVVLVTFFTGTLGTVMLTSAAGTATFTPPAVPGDPAAVSTGSAAGAADSCKRLLLLCVCQLVDLDAAAETKKRAKHNIAAGSFMLLNNCDQPLIL